MKLLIQKRGEVLSTGIQGLVLETTLLLPGACSCCSCETSSSTTTSAVTASVHKFRAGKA
jgi:hypothetical protein